MGLLVFFNQTLGTRSIVITPPQQTTGLIPINTSKEFYNSSSYSNLAGKGWFDGDITVEPIPSYTESFTPATWTLNFRSNTTLEKVRWYDGTGSNSGNGTSPVTMQVFNLTSNQWETFKEFDGELYPPQWAEVVFDPPIPVSRFRMINHETKAVTPLEIQFYGTSDVEPTIPPFTNGSYLMDQFGVNHLWYERDWVQLQAYSSWRVYMDLATLEFQDIGETTNKIRFSPSVNADYDEEVDEATTRNRPMIAVFTNNALANYPGYPDPSLAREANRPYHANPLDPATYLNQLPFIEQWEIRNGPNPFNINPTNVSTGQRYNNDFIHQALKGRNKNYRLFILNEAGKTWKGPDVWQSAEASIVCWAVMYDGYNGLYPNRGVKNINPNAKLGLGHSFQPDVGWLLLAILKAGEIWGWNSDGTLKVFPHWWDLHHYNSGLDHLSTSLELSALQEMIALQQVLNKYTGGRSKISMTEYGSTNSPNAMLDGVAPYYYTPAKNGLSAEKRRAALIIGQGLWHSWLGFEFSNIYALKNQDADVPNTNWDKLAGIENTLTEKYIIQLRPLAEGYKATTLVNNQVNTSLPYILTLEKPNSSKLYAIWASDGITTPATVNLPNGGTRYDFSDTNSNMTSSVLSSGTVSITPSELPIFILAN